MSAVGDFNGDGRPDIAVCTDNNIVSVFLNAAGLLRQATAVTVSSNLNPSSPIDPLTIAATVASAVVSSRRKCNIHSRRDHAVLDDIHIRRVPLVRLTALDRQLSLFLRSA